MSSRFSGRALLIVPAAVLGAAYTLPLLSHAHIAHYTRYMADDFCFAGEALNRGLVGAEVFWFTTSNARYSFLLLDGLTAVIGAWTAAALPALVLAAWFAALVWLLAQVRLGASRNANLGLALVAAAVTLGATVSVIPNPAQSIYWKGGLLTYTAPLAAGTFLAALMLWQSRQPVRWSGATIIAAVAFAAGGFSELYTVVQAALLALTLAAALAAARFRRPSDADRRNAVLIAVALAATVLALLTLSFAPGTLARRATFPAAPSLSALVWNSWQYSLWFLRDAAAQHGGLLLAVAATGAAIGAWAPAGPRAAPRRLLALWLLLPLATLALLMAAYATAFYAVLFLPPDRVLIIHWFFINIAVGAWGYLAGLAIRPAAAAASSRWPIPSAFRALLALAVAGALAAPPIIAAIRVAALRTDAQNYATTWDAFDRQLRAAREAGAGSLALPLLENPGGIDNYSADPQFWVNQCAQLYYGLAVTAFDPPPLPNAVAIAHRTPLEAEIGGAARVLGYRLDAPLVRAGGALTVTIFWQPLRGTLQPQTVFLHLYDPAAGQSLAQADRAPGDGRYPTTLWIHGRIFADRFELQLPAGTPPTQAVLIVGLYDLSTSQRLPVTGPDAGPAGTNWVQFGEVDVVP